ncbi:hypothetical protein LFT45_05535 [Arthrobacter sp. FW305-BF8]|uniref:hypothetical protein n=1 Tax=Arthrobacter sp. FW305-BF8 TaxID=2879617 RepID=UPI001F2C0EA5|nr:hypothetical protein [Arthrobacter sp. FW305-BF8]UKA55386.1 hypothetical protein LFT45_05535 [Arthrobacter sp. FW305-BF8]
MMTPAPALLFLCGAMAVALGLGGCDPGQASSQVTLIAGGQPTGSVVQPWPSGQPEPTGMPVPQGAPPPKTLAFTAPADAQTEEVESLEVKAGKDGLSISSVSLSMLTGEQSFAIISDSCSGVALSSGQTCTITFSYKPGDIGRKKAEVVLRSEQEKPVAIVYLDGTTTSGKATPSPEPTTSTDPGPTPDPTPTTDVPSPDPTEPTTDPPSPQPTTADVPTSAIPPEVVESQPSP